MCDVHILCVGTRVLMNLGVEARGKRQVSSLAILHLVFLKQGLLLNLEFTDLARLAGQ